VHKTQFLVVSRLLTHMKTEQCGFNWLSWWPYCIISSEANFFLIRLMKTASIMKPRYSAVINEAAVAQFYGTCLNQYKVVNIVSMPHWNKTTHDLP